MSAETAVRSHCKHIINETEKPVHDDTKKYGGTQFRNIFRPRTQRCEYDPNRLGCKHREENDNSTPRIDRHKSVIFCA